MSLKQGKKAKEDKIMEVAVASFRNKGIEETSIRDIMDGTDFGLGTFYLYFKDKKDLEEKIVSDFVVDLFHKAEGRCESSSNVDRYISFINYIITDLEKAPMELNLILRNLNWALYGKIESDVRFKETDTALKFVLNKNASLFPGEYSEAEQLFILYLMMQLVLSTCKSALQPDSPLTIEQMKAVLLKIVNSFLESVRE